MIILTNKIKYNKIIFNSTVTEQWDSQGYILK